MYLENLLTYVSYGDTVTTHFYSITFIVLLLFSVLVLAILYRGINLDNVIELKVEIFGDFLYF
jgi:hypothetical protein